MKKIIVIGAGTAGLVSAIYLQNEGYDVHIYEKNEKVGGKMYQIGGEGFTFDVGPTIVMMPELYNEVFSMCGRNPKDYIPMEPVEPMLTLNFSDSEPMLFSSDLTKLTTMLEGISEEDAKGWFRYLADIYDKYQIAKDAFITRSFRGPLDFYNPNSLWQGLKLKTFDDAYTSISKYVKDDRLRKALAFQTLYIGISPYEGPSLYTIIPMIELLYGVWFIKGGMYSMAKGMERLFTELGGTIHYNQNVEEIYIENKAAKGIIANGENISADYIICNADFPYAMDDLIPDNKNKGKYTPEKIKKMEYSCSCYVLYLGLDKEYPVESLHTIRFAKDFDKNVNDIFENEIFPEDPSFYIYVPSFADKSLAPEGKQAVYILVPVPHLGEKELWDEKSTAIYRDKVLSLVEKETVFTDIRDHICWEDCFTPKRYEETFNAKNGATFGLRPSLMQSNYYRPHNKFPYCENLYFCGSSTHPGAGVPIALTGGKLAAKELLKDDRSNTNG